VIGIDMTHEMLKKARENAAKIDLGADSGGNRPRIRDDGTQHSGDGFHEHSGCSERVYHEHTQLLQRVFGVYALIYGPARRAGKG
jgi:hypothetical protein